MGPALEVTDEIDENCSEIGEHGRGHCLIPTLMDRPLYQMKLTDTMDAGGSNDYRHILFWAQEN